MQSVTDQTSSDVFLADEQKSADILGRGYTLQPFLGPADVDALRKLHADTLPAGTSEYYVTAFSSDIAGKRHIYESIRAIVEPKLAKLAPGYSLLNASFVTKKAGSTRGRLALHQDYSLVDHEVNLGLNVWIPLMDVDTSNGCMRMVDFSREFHHISATPPNPSPYDPLRPELEANYLTDVPMPCGTAVLFDTRVLHATEENRTTTDRVAVFLNLYPAHATPRLHFWNPKEPNRLEIFEVDSEFMIALPPNRYLEDSEKTAAKFLGYMDYTPRKWGREELEGKLPKAPKPVVVLTPAEEAAQSARKAVAYLIGSQLPDGEFQTEFCYNRRETEDGQTVEDLMFDSSPFVTSLVLYSLDFAKGLDPKIADVTRKGIQFLVSEMDPGGLWRYWARKNPKRPIIPPDLDDTSCISHLLKTHGVTVPDNHWLFYDSRDKRGAFFTWLYKADSWRKKLLSLKTGGKAFSHTDELWQWTKGADVCAVVNANCLMYLGETDGTKKAIDYLLGVLRDGTEDKEIVFYAHSMSLYYFASRALFTGVKALGAGKPIMLERILAQQQPDGSFGDELLTGLAVCALLNLNENSDRVAKAVQYLISTQRDDGSWKRVPMYGGPPTPTTFGSADLTTGICLEALARVSAGAGK
jgi:ectoine hydroxylase-related dioxygenase (phytanoyl-CoA dioxygenase family)